MMMMMMMMMMMIKYFYRTIDRRKAFQRYFQKGPLSEILVIANLQYAKQGLNLRRTWVQTSLIADAIRRH